MIRTFVDATGTPWTVWEVKPGAAAMGDDERRSGTERRGELAPEPVIERRRDAADRRRRAVSWARGVEQALAGGWLTFQSDAEHRRLAPVPPGWAHAPESDLAALCRRARPTRMWSGGALA
jgi:hypothetical protein